VESEIWNRFCKIVTQTVTRTVCKNLTQSNIKFCVTSQNVCSCVTHSLHNFCVLAEILCVNTPIRRLTEMLAPAVPWQSKNSSAATARSRLENWPGIAIPICEVVNQIRCVEANGRTKHKMA
jgi:hypothetical protein